MALYKLLLVACSICLISLNTQAESFKLISVKMAKSDPLFPPATIKKYQALKPVKVNYSYEFSPYDNDFSLYVDILDTTTNFEDLTAWGILINNLKSPVVSSHLIRVMPKKMNQSCSYNGSAVVVLKNIELVIPEVASEVSFTSNISKILSFSKPKTKCYQP